MLKPAWTESIRFIVWHTRTAYELAAYSASCCATVKKDDKKVENEAAAWCAETDGQTPQTPRLFIFPDNKPPTLRLTSFWPLSAFL